MSISILTSLATLPQGKSADTTGGRPAISTHPTDGLDFAGVLMAMPGHGTRYEKLAHDLASSPAVPRVDTPLAIGTDSTNRSPAAWPTNDPPMIIGLALGDAVPAPPANPVSAENASEDDCALANPPITGTPADAMPIPDALAPIPLALQAPPASGVEACGPQGAAPSAAKSGPDVSLAPRNDLPTRTSAKTTDAIGGGSSEPTMEGRAATLQAPPAMASASLAEQRRTDAEQNVTDKTTIDNTSAALPAIAGISASSQPIVVRTPGAVGSGGQNPPTLHSSSTPPPLRVAAVVREVPPSLRDGEPAEKRLSTSSDGQPAIIAAAPMDTIAVAAASASGSPAGETAPPPDSPTQLGTLTGYPVAASAGSASEAPHALQATIRDPSWSNELGQKLIWLSHNDKQQAHLTLNPPQLGALEITLNVDKDNATAYFVSANADVRSAIEAALPRLREMFATAGIDLGQVGVGSESFRQQSDSRQQAMHAYRPATDNAILVSDITGNSPHPAVALRHGSALVDIFA